MDYYILTEDERIKYPLKFGKNIFGKKNEDMVVTVDIDEKTLCADYIQSRHLIDVCTVISEKVKSVIVGFNSDIRFFGVFATSKDMSRQLAYWQFDKESIENIPIDNVPNIDAISINSKDIGGEIIFRLSNKSQEFIAVREDLAESIIRRKPLGIKFKKLNINGGE